ncbi:flagellar basal body-associated FliL family protein [Halospina sp. K52047b]|uniref:flagellar basal body-associated FliL family protein n=1 Tax=Halospina sp. K52047b TaxID=2614160 RepID=UPI00124A5214|nr:flagellar basal body-associated FliL family protein [Halospina sp. K52047b]KAA8981308.1 flagellar basal body-associated FliL family protein [Halospina sp. K52047b]
MRQFTVLLLALAAPLALAAGGGGSDGPPSTYLELSPAFVVNIGDADEAGSYAKAEVTLRFHDAKAREKAEAHTPWLRHEVVMLMSGRSVDELRSAEGQETLRSDIRRAVSKRLVSELPELEQASGQDQADSEENNGSSGDEASPSGPVREVLLPDFIVQSR